MGDRTAPGGLEAWLALAGSQLPGPGLDLEYSVRLSQAGVSASGRATCWAGPAPGAAAAVGRILARLGAPADVLAQQAALESPVRQGIGIDTSGAEPEYRLYLHGRRSATLAPHYRSWRWRPGGGARSCAYSFHFLPETPAGLRPADLVRPGLRPMLARLLAEDGLRQSSGFWLRETGTGRIDQLDLAFPWHPRAGSLAGLAALARNLGAGPAAGWQDLPVRHVALSVGPGPTVLTLYVSGPAAGPLPADEAGWQARARRGAARSGQWARRCVLDRVPDLPPGPAGPGLDHFYGGDLATWRRVLGPRLHYHHGLFDAALDPDPDAAADRAVTELYPFIPARSRLYDIGCGWGGPLEMLIRDLRCPALGVTISRSQFRYAASRGLPVRWGDAERTLPPGLFGCVLMLESFEHIWAKERLLQVLRIFAGRLVMRVNCQDSSPPSAAFAGTMHMISSGELRALIESAGWRITHWRDRRPEALPSVAHWNRRASRGDLVPDAHLDALRAWSRRVLAAPAEWAAANPLIELVADPGP